MTIFNEGLSFSLTTHRDIDNVLLAKKIICKLLEGPKFLRPKRFGGYHPLNQRVDPNDIQPIIDLWMGNDFGGNMRGSLILRFCRRGEISIQWEKGESPPSVTPKFQSVCGEVPTTKITKVQKRLGEFLNLIFELVGLVNPVYGEIQYMMTPNWHKPYDLQLRLPDIPWGSIYGEPYISMWGREKILKAPFFQVKELPSGHIFAQLTESILDPELPRGLRDQVQAYFGEASFMRGSKTPRFYKTGIAPNFD